MKYFRKYPLRFILLFTCLAFMISCKTTKENNKEGVARVFLSSNCLASLELKNYEMSKEHIQVVKQFLSKNECNKEALDFSKKAMKAFNDGTIKQINLTCLDKYFDMSQKSPFGISFGGVFSCENL